MTTLGTLLTNLLFLGSTTIEDAIFRFDSHWIHRLSMNIEGSYSGSIAVDVPSNAGRFTASFEYAAVHDIQTADADVSDNRPFSLDAESTIAVHVPRNHSIHVQVARLDIALHDAVFPDDHSSRNGNVAVNTSVNTDISGAFYTSYDGCILSDNCLNITCGNVDMFFHAAIQKSFTSAVYSMLSFHRFFSLQKYSSLSIYKIYHTCPPPQDILLLSLDFACGGPKGKRRAKQKRGCRRKKDFFL
jgi:hypothetical protein